MKNLIFITTLFFLVQSCFQEKNPIVVMETEIGNIEFEIFANGAPITAGNFLELVDDGVYTNACFYRVVRMDNQPVNPVKIQVIQGGLQVDSLIYKYQSIAHETTDVTGVRHLDGVISMARNAPGSASTEFFICVEDQPELDFGGKRNPDGQGFAAFGRVIRGMDVVREIQLGADEGQMLREEVKINNIIRK